MMPRLVLLLLAALAVAQAFLAPAPVAVQRGSKEMVCRGRNSRQGLVR